jgi:hypothetical protein
MGGLHHVWKRRIQHSGGLWRVEKVQKRLMLHQSPTLSLSCESSHGCPHVFMQFGRVVLGREHHCGRKGIGVPVLGRFRPIPLRVMRARHREGYALSANEQSTRSSNFSLDL